MPPFEITDANRPFMIQISEGSTRELDERALKFLHTYAKRIEVLDAKNLDYLQLMLLLWITLTIHCLIMYILFITMNWLKRKNIRFQHVDICGK